jgi:phosphoribosylamine--glycine ligase
MSKIDVLLIGSGGREHALAWKLKQSLRLGTLYIAPGNPGMANLGELVSIKADDIPGLLEFALSHNIGLTVVGPEDPLNAGIVDTFKKKGLRIFGPSAQAAQIESSKVWAKNLMFENGIPTAAYFVFSDYDRALEQVRRMAGPFVIKASGLALGKGVYVCHTVAAGIEALDKLFVEKAHGPAGSTVVIEAFLPGREVSAHALCDGRVGRLMLFSEDHKQAFDGDVGPNTGGMGTYAPVSWMSPDLPGIVQREIVDPVLQCMTDSPFVGLLYPGLMIDDGYPKVLEFNCRFGDPETQVLMRLLKNDLLELFEACVDGTLGSHTLQWENKHAICVVLASGGYPGPYAKGLPITGLDAVADSDVVVFHAGTAIKDGQLVTNGGRVLGVTAIADTLEEARVKVYAAIERHIRFKGMHYRKDIGARKM